jgi:dipeptidyl aminopeptidase/acylaminoacyl peptidase
MCVDLKTSDTHHLAPDSVIADSFGWSPDSTQIAFLQVDVGRDEANLVLANADGRASRTVSKIKHGVGSYVTPFWDEASKRIYILIGGALWRVSVESGESREFARIPGRRIIRRVAMTGDLIWVPDGGKSTIVLTSDPEGKQNGFYSVDLTTGETSKLLESGQCFDCNSRGSSGGFSLVAASRRHVAYIAQDAQHPPDLWVSDPGFLKPHHLTRLNPEFDRYVVGSPRLIRWLSLDGKPLKGGLLLPPGYDPAKRYPLIVYVYPTTLSDDYDRFGFGVYPGPFNLHLFATRGYAVLLPDVQSEGGMNAARIEGSVLPGINETIRLGIVDPERIGVIGHSAGGYSTLALITRTGRFRAAMEVSGYADLLGLYGQLSRDGSAYESDEVGRLLGADPWQDPVRYIQNSPIYYLDRIRAPLLIVHGGEDDAASSTLADELFVTLRRLGKEAEYAKYYGESHVPRDWSYANQLDLCQRQLDWFETRLKSESVPAPPQP